MNILKLDIPDTYFSAHIFIFSYFHREKKVRGRSHMIVNDFFLGQTNIFKSLRWLGAYYINILTLIALSQSELCAQRKWLVHLMIDAQLSVILPSFPSSLPPPIWSGVIYYPQLFSTFERVPGFRDTQGAKAFLSILGSRLTFDWLLWWKKIFIHQEASLDPSERTPLIVLRDLFLAVLMCSSRSTWVPRTSSGRLIWLKA